MFLGKMPAAAMPQGRQIFVEKLLSRYSDQKEGPTASYKSTPDDLKAEEMTNFIGPFGCFFIIYLRCFRYQKVV